MALTNSGFDGTVTEAAWAQMSALTAVDAVESAAAWAVTQGTGRQVSTAAHSGFAFAKGVLSKDTAAILTGLATPTNGQWFLIVRHIDWSTNGVTVTAIAHTTTSTTAPTAPPTGYPTVDNNPGVLYDQMLAWAWVNSADTTVTLFDLRLLPQDTRVRRFSGTTTLRNAFAARDGDLWDDTTTAITYKRISNAWKAWESDRTIYTPSYSGFTPGTGGSTLFGWQLIGGWMNLDFRLILGSSGGSVGGVAFDLPAGYQFASDYKSYEKVGVGQAGSNATPSESSDLVILRNAASTTSVSLWGNQVAASASAVYPMHAATSGTIPVTFAAGGRLLGTARFRV